MELLEMQEGIRWQECENFRLRHLASLHAAKLHPELDDVVVQHDGAIQVSFGYMTERIRLRDVGSGADMLFLNGFCVLFAYALHERLGLPFGVITDERHSWLGWSGHAGLMLDDELFVDIRGVRPLSEVVKEFALVDYSHETVDKDEFLNRLVDAPLRSNPMLFVEELEQLVTEDFAYHVIQSDVRLQMVERQLMTMVS